MNQIEPVTEFLKRGLRTSQRLYLLPGEEHNLVKYTETIYPSPFCYYWDNAGDSRHQYFDLKVECQKAGSIFLDTAVSIDEAIKTKMSALRPIALVTPHGQTEQGIERSIWAAETEYDLGLNYPFENAFYNPMKYSTGIYLHINLQMLHSPLIDHIQSFSDALGTHRLLFLEGDIMKLFGKTKTDEDTGVVIYYPNIFSLLSAQGTNGDNVLVIIVENTPKNVVK